MTVPLRLQIDRENARAVVHLPRADMAAQGLHPGQTARLGQTHVRLRPEAREGGTLGLDPETARNAGLQDGAPAALEPRDLPVLASVLISIDDGAPARPEDLAEALFDMTLTAGDRVSLTLPRGKRITADIRTAEPGGAGRVTGATAVLLESDGGQVYETIGGLRKQIAAIREMVETPLRRPELYKRLGLEPPRGVLFTGPPGSGKTLLARAVADQTDARFFQIRGPEIITKHYGDSEAALRQVFEAAAKAAPAIIFIDEIDAIAPARGALSADKQVERRLVAQMLTLMDGLSDRGRVIVMAATNLPDALDPALRRPGRFDREVAFTPPDASERREILAVHLAQSPLGPDVDLDDIAGRCHGYVGADLAALTREAAVAALARAVGAAGHEAGVSAETLFVTQSDLEAGLAATSPSALRGTAAPMRTVGWDDIGGLDAAKDALTQAVLWPLSHRDTLSALRLTPARGVLLTGPPGTGKTLLARALAAEGGLNFVPVRAPSLLSEYFGAAERAIADLFRTARQSAPCLLFFDELDALAPRRSGADSAQARMVAQLLVEIDGITASSGVIALAATNRAAAIDPALIRPGRFDVTIALGLPDAETRADILAVHLQGRAVSGDLDIDALTKRLDGASGADLEALAHTAARAAMVRHVQTPEVPCAITLDDLRHAEAAWHAGRHARTQDHIGQEQP